MMIDFVVVDGKTALELLTSENELDTEELFRLYFNRHNIALIRQIWRN